VSPARIYRRVILHYSDPRLIAHPKDRVATLPDVQSLPFFSPLPFSRLREVPAPFVPVLDGDTDVGYFDSFESAEDMAKYAEVFKKQRDVEAVEEKGQGNRNNWVGFTFGKNHVSGLSFIAIQELMRGCANANWGQAGGRGVADHVLVWGALWKRVLFLLFPRLVSSCTLIPSTLSLLLPLFRTLPTLSLF